MRGESQRSDDGTLTGRKSIAARRAATGLKAIATRAALSSKKVWRLRSGERSDAQSLDQWACGVVAAPIAVMGRLILNRIAFDRQSRRIKFCAPTWLKTIAAKAAPKTWRLRMGGRSDARSLEGLRLGAGLLAADRPDRWAQCPN
jgi:hypothetical protein